MAGETFGKYVVIRRLAMGGMAEVALARLEGAAGFNKLVVIKHVLPHLAQDPDFIEMFLDEGRLAARLMHPNIAQTFELGESDGRYFMAMEYVRGKTLTEVFRRARELKVSLPMAAALRVAMLLLEALKYAHALRGDDGKPLGLVHRDVSPGNVMVTFDGAVKLLDFGIAKAVTQSHHTEAGRVKGKAGFMSPEQCRGHAIDARSDLYSAGAILYQLTTGERPFERQVSGNELYALMLATLKGGFDKPTAVRPELPPELDTLIGKAMALEVGERYPSAAPLLVEVEALCARLGTFPSAQRLADVMEQLFGDHERGELSADAEPPVLATPAPARSATRRTMPPPPPPPADTGPSAQQEVARRAASEEPSLVEASAILLSMDPDDAQATQAFAPVDPDDEVATRAFPPLDLSPEVLAQTELPAPRAGAAPGGLRASTAAALEAEAAARAPRAAPQPEALASRAGATSSGGVPPLSAQAKSPAEVAAASAQEPALAKSSAGASPPSRQAPPPFGRAAEGAAAGARPPSSQAPVAAQSIGVPPPLGRAKSPAHGAAASAQEPALAKSSAGTSPPPGQAQGGAPSSVRVHPPSAQAKAPAGSGAASAVEPALAKLDVRAHAPDAAAAGQAPAAPASAGEAPPAGGASAGAPREAATASRSPAPATAPAGSAPARPPTAAGKPSRAAAAAVAGAVAVLLAAALWKGRATSPESEPAKAPERPEARAAQRPVPVEVAAAPAPLPTVGGPTKAPADAPTEADPTASPIAPAPTPPAALPPNSPATAPVAPPAPVAAGAPTSVGTGQLKVDAYPWAYVTWRGKTLGETPVSAQLPAGEQVLTLTNPELKMKRTVKLVIKARGVTTHFERFEGKGP